MLVYTLMLVKSMTKWEKKIVMHLGLKNAVYSDLTMHVHEGEGTLKFETFKFFWWGYIV